VTIDLNAEGTKIEVTDSKILNDVTKDDTNIEINEKGDMFILSATNIKVLNYPYTSEVKKLEFESTKLGPMRLYLQNSVIFT
jgi:hypothetical protein